MNITMISAMRLLKELGVRERAGAERNHPAIVWAYELCSMGEGIGDEVPWCAAILNLAAVWAGVRRSGSAAARSWLQPGLGLGVYDPSLFPATLRRLRGEQNVVLIFKRAGGTQGAAVTDAPGHVAVYLDFSEAQLDRVRVIGGNQSDAITEVDMPIDRLIGIVALYPVIAKP